MGHEDYEATDVAIRGGSGRGAADFLLGHRHSSRSARSFRHVRFTPLNFWLLGPVLVSGGSSQGMDK